MGSPQSGPPKLVHRNIFRNEIGKLVARKCGWRTCPDRAGPTKYDNLWLEELTV